VGGFARDSYTLRTCCPVTRLICTSYGGRRYGNQNFCALRTSCTPLSNPRFDGTTYPSASSRGRHPEAYACLRMPVCISTSAQARPHMTGVVCLSASTCPLISVSINLRMSVCILRATYAWPLGRPVHKGRLRRFCTRDHQDVVGMTDLLS
jgi:hypothetical protein